MLLLLAALACSDKDPGDSADSADTSTDSRVDDTGEDTGDDTGVGNQCELEPIFAVVLGINNTKESVAIPIDCLKQIDGGAITSVGLSGKETTWEFEGQTVFADPSVLDETGVLDARLPVALPATPFAKYGQMMFLLVLAACIAGAIGLTIGKEKAP